VFYFPDKKEPKNQGCEDRTLRTARLQLQSAKPASLKQRRFPNTSVAGETRFAQTAQIS
jgi:hypothetical protein